MSLIISHKHTLTSFSHFGFWQLVVLAATSSSLPKSKWYPIHLILPPKTSYICLLLFIPLPLVQAFIVTNSATAPSLVPHFHAHASLSHPPWLPEPSFHSVSSGWCPGQGAGVPAVVGGDTWYNEGSCISLMLQPTWRESTCFPEDYSLWSTL